MCGIVGIVALTPGGKDSFKGISSAVEALSKRGPDFQQTLIDNNIGLGHARLSIIDTSTGANQPFTDSSGRYTLVFNGEIYNYQEERYALQQQGVNFTTNSDTEVLLHLYIHYKEKCLDRLNGFFAFAVYDKHDQSLFIARDRMGIKPLLYYLDDDKFIFASEQKAMFPFEISKELDMASLFTYLQLNYIPGPNTMLKKVKKLTPGCFLKIENLANFKLPEETKYYEIPPPKDPVLEANSENYNKAKSRLRELLFDSVESRLVADVPLGTFLSGGVDSSIISFIAKQFKKDLNTFSIGFKDEPQFDESSYANQIASHLKTNHHVFNVSNQDLEEHLYDVLDYLDEPFADSSALPVYLLSKFTKEHVKVALSGDGADEMFSGYNKHFAEFKARNPGIKGAIVKGLNPILKKFPSSRHGYYSNLNRKLIRYGDGVKLSSKDRYWKWASLASEEEANYLLKETGKINFQRLSDDAYNYKKRKERLLLSIQKGGTFNDVLYTDMHLVLQNDMLRKVDLMSMANGLEVRTPFLDHKVVDFVFSLPSIFKINATSRKKILKDTFEKDMPPQFFNRDKQGFEVPLLNWFKGDLKAKIEGEWLNNEFIADQGIFNPEATKFLKNKLWSSSPGETVATVWALIVFQHWWKRYIE